MLDEDYEAMENSLSSASLSMSSASSNMSSASSNMSFPNALIGNPNAKNGSSIRRFEDDIIRLSTAVFREMILPQLIKEVNEGKTFAQTRQVYQSVILATWYKKALKDSLLNKIYADKSKIEGIKSDDKDIKQKVYDQYVEAFQKAEVDLGLRGEQNPGDTNSSAKGSSSLAEAKAPGGIDFDPSKLNLQTLPILG